MDLPRFDRGMRLALWQCARVGLALEGNVVREDKAPDSPHQTSTAVTVVDRLCQEILLLAAHALEPGQLAVRSEEMEDCPPALRRLFDGAAGRYLLLLDPLDGTEAYLRGSDGWAHMAGVLDRDAGRMIWSAICFPRRDRLYAARRGEGVRVEDGPSGPVRLPGTPRSAPRTVAEVKRLTAADRAAIAGLAFRIDASRNVSAADDLVAVAEGAIGASVMRHFHAHDSAIPGLLVEEAGGAVLGADGLPVRYDGTMARVPLVVSSVSAEWARVLHAAIAGPGSAP